MRAKTGNSVRFRFRKPGKWPLSRKAEVLRQELSAAGASGFSMVTLTVLGSGDGTQSLVHTTQMLYHLVTAPDLFYI